MCKGGCGKKFPSPDHRTIHVCRKCQEKIDTAVYERRKQTEFERRQNAKKTLVRCLGWCNGTFLSSDPRKIRFCNDCRRKKDNAYRSLSKIETNAIREVDIVF